jgi:hypothetical protein
MGLARSHVFRAPQFQAHVAAAFGPFVALLGQDGADEPDQRLAAGEDPDDVGAAAGFLVSDALEGAATARSTVRAGGPNSQFSG